MPAKPASPAPSKLLAAITSAGGTLTIPDPPARIRSRYHRSIHFLINSELLGPNRRLRYTGRDRGDMVLSIVLVQDLPATRPTPIPVSVPPDLRSCHPVIRATQEAAKGLRWIHT